MNVQPMLDLPVVDSVSSPVFEEKCKTAEQNSPDKSDPRFYRPELDCLRFVAFLLVFSCHSLHGFTKLSVAGAFLQHMAAGGAFGVDLFFILSAYLITELLRREKHLTGRVDVRAFYMRRILRIWPLYFAFLTFWFLVRRFTPTTFPLSAFMAFVLFSGNWYMVRAEVRSPFVSPVDPLWSVSVEEQFYLAWPLIVRFASRAELIVSAICLCIVSLIAQFVLLRAGVPHIAIWVNSLVHTGAIGVGVLSAVLLAGSTPRIPLFPRE
jgi:peptidoglycan/LPS O-acetylase OafA/YrhL